MEAFEAYYEQMLDAISRYMPGANQELIDRAVEYANSKHKFQKRKDGSPYIIHPLAVAQIVAEMGLDTDSVLGALLHDCIEDTDASFDDIAKLFNPTVAELVEGVTKLTRTDFTSQEEKQMENLRKMFMAMSKDIRVVLIKIADRLHNMRTMQYQSPQKQIIKCQETMDIYAPLAHRLGMQKIKWELEDISLQYLDPQGYQELDAQLQEYTQRNEAFMNTIQSTIAMQLSSMGIHNNTYGRVKHIYSVYRKMKDQDKKLDELYDLYAFRVVVSTIPDCYNVLGHIHSLFNLVPGRFKDYISTPKPNGYQSLHTTVIGKQGIPFEVQIRTWEMHATAEYGVAAHWKYKQKSGSGAEKDFEWVRRLLESQQDTEATEADDYLSSLKIDMFNDEVFVFSPKGSVISLPRGATPIDFAYAIHSGVGNAMVGAKVNNRIVNIDSELRNGDIVEILTSKAARGPSRDWLNICKSNQARAKIRQWFKRERREENILHGKSSFEAEMRRLNLPMSLLSDPELAPQLLSRLSFTAWEDMYAAIGYGGMTAVKAVGRIRDDLTRAIRGQAQEVQAAHRPAEPTGHHSRHAVNGVIVQDIDSCMIKFARCCAPVPGDAIVGYITRGNGVSVHRADCPNTIGRYDPAEASRWVQVRWDDAEDQPFETTLELDCITRDGLVADVTTTLVTNRIRLNGITANDLSNGHSAIILRLVVNNVTQLGSIRQKLMNIRDVIGSRRGKN